MEPSRLRQIAELFELAVDLPPGERTRFLQMQCHGDEDLLAEVKETLIHDQAAGRFLEGSPQQLSGTEELQRVYIGAAPDQVGGFRILRKIGEGGMGIVYEASQPRLSRPVALKILRNGVFSPTVLRRFEYEAQLLGRLRHPCIAQVYEAGVYEAQTGPLPFIAMEYVAEALPITEYATARGLDTPRKLECFALICDAVHHGHQKGVIHRDLKPSNILVDPTGQPKVIDFGVGCCIDPDAAIPTMQTTVGQLVGTLQYMSPEQCAANGGDIDTRSDVYSLGVVLFQLMTGRMPYDVPTESLFETMRAIRETLPPRLSGINRRLGGDLDTIVRKAMEKDRTRRYESAAEFAEDIRRFLRHEPIIARAPTILYQLRRFAQRNRALVGGLVAVSMVLVAGVIATSLQTIHANSAREDAERRAYEACIFAADAAIAANDGGAAMHRLQQAPTSLCNWEWRYLSRCADQSVKVFHGLDLHKMVQVSFSPDSNVIAGVSFGSDAPSHLLVWLRSTGRQVFDGLGRAGFNIPYAFVPDGQLRMCNPRNELCTIDPIVGTEVDRRVMPNAIATCMPAIMSPSLFVQGWSAGLPRQIIGFWNAGEKSNRGEFPLDEGHWISAGAVSEDGRRIAVVQNDGTVFLRDTIGVGPPTRIHGLDGPTSGLALSDNATQLAVCGDRGEIKVWTVGENAQSLPATPISFRQTASLRGSGQMATCVAFSPDHALLASGSADKTIRVWRLSDSTLLETLLGHVGTVTSVAFSRDGKSLVSGSSDSSVRLWSLSEAPAVTIRRDMPGIVSVVAFDSSGLRLGTNVARGVPEVLDTVTGRTLFEMSQLPAVFDRAAFSRDGACVVNQFDDGSIRATEIPGAHERFRIETGIAHLILPLAFSPDETQVAWADTSGHVHLFDAHSRTSFGDLDQHGDRVTALAYSPDGKCLASGTESGALTFWTLADKKSMTLRNHKSELKWIAYSKDGRRVATASQDETVNLCDAADGHVLRTLHPQIGDVWSASFSPDGSRLAVGGRDRTVRMFDTATGGELLTLRGPTGTVMCVAFSPDGRRIAAGSWSHEVFIWDAGPAKPVSSSPR